MSSNPFQSPGSTAELERDSPYTYLPLRVLTIIVAIAFGVQVFLLLATHASTAWLQSHDPSVFTGGEPRDGTSALLAIVLFLSSLSYLVIYLGGIFFFFMWLVRANKNARALGARDMEFTPGWMVGWFFVPLANLFKPYEAVEELYLASDPRKRRRELGRPEMPRTILAWWLSWIAFGLTSYFVSLWTEPSTPAALLPALFNGVAAALAITVLASIDRRQIEKRKRLAVSPARPPRSWSVVPILVKLPGIPRPLTPSLPAGRNDRRTS